MTEKNSKKTHFKFSCEKCFFYSNNKNDFNRHLKTKKHNTTNTTNNTTQKTQHCLCGKTYTHRASLYNHKKSCKELCKNVQNEGISEDWKNQKAPAELVAYHKDDLKDILKQILVKHSEVLEKNDILMEKNEELLEKITDIASQPKKVVNNTQFNVMNYLNTECKDAMDFNEFIDTFEFTLEDIDILSNKGYQESMERTFLKQLRDMDKTKRPIHCSDMKRKSFYVKENGVWVKDTDCKKMIRGVKRFSGRHFLSLNQWRLRNPDYHDNDRKFKYHFNAIHQACRCNDMSHVKKVINKMTGLSVKG